MSMLPRIENRPLKTTLTEGERREKAMHAAELMEDARKIEVEAEGLKSSAKEKLEHAKGKQVDARLDLGVMKQGWEVRNVDVRSEWSEDGKMVQEVRTDTGEIISTRPPTPIEQQETLPQIGSKKAK